MLNNIKCENWSRPDETEDSFLSGAHYRRRGGRSKRGHGSGRGGRDLLRGTTRWRTGVQVLTGAWPVTCTCGAAENGDENVHHDSENKKRSASVWRMANLLQEEGRDEEVGRAAARVQLR
jgi:hypothetical protein